MSKEHFFDKPGNLKKFVSIFLGTCAVLLVVDFLDLLRILPFKEIHFDIEGWFGFYGLYGFVGCTLLVLAAKVLRKIVMREEDYYDR